MEVECLQDMAANEHVMVSCNSYEKVKTFHHLGSLLTNHNSFHEEIKCRVKAWNSCYYSVQTLLSPQLFSKKIKIYKKNNIASYAIGCET